MDMRFVDLFTASVGDQVAALLDAFAAVAPGCFDTNHMASCRAACGPAQPPTSLAMFGGLGVGRAPAAPSPPAVTPHKWAVAGGAGGPGPTALEAAGAQVRAVHVCGCGCLVRCVVWVWVCERVGLPETEGFE
jgi:hypothetical protein